MTPPEKQPDGENNSTNLLVLVGVILLVVGTVYLLLELKAGVAIENCEARGRHDCQPVDMPLQ